MKKQLITYLVVAYVVALVLAIPTITEPRTEKEPVTISQLWVASN